MDGKISLLLNMPQKLREKVNLKMGRVIIGDKIKLIILYEKNPGQIKETVESAGGSFTDIGFKYAVIKFPINRLRELSENENIAFVYLPADYVPADIEVNKNTCVSEAKKSYNLTGKGVLVGFVDTGIDYMHPAFMDKHGNSRIEYIYDLSTENPSVYTKEQINEALHSENPHEIVHETDSLGHGTSIAGIVCGGGNIPEIYKGAATESSIIMVKADSTYDILSSDIMLGIKFILDKSRELDMPAVIILGISSNQGAHNEGSALEQYIKLTAELERVTIVAAAGNEGNTAHHAGGKIDGIKTEQLNIEDGEDNILISIYKTLLPHCSINIISPTGERSGNINISEGYYFGNIGKDKFDLYVSGPNYLKIENGAYLILSTTEKSITPGIWRFEIIPDKTGEQENDNESYTEYDMWLPVSEKLNTQTRFSFPEIQNTLGLPATVTDVIAVGSYNIYTRDVSAFSGRGVNSDEIMRPDVVAPGENVWAPVPGGGYERKTGTSMAAAAVGGICALMMEWGFSRGNDPYMYGQRLKYYLLKGTDFKRPDVNYPNSSWGYGNVCVNESIVILENTINNIRSDFRISPKTKNILESLEDKSIEDKMRIYNYRKSTFNELLEDISSLEISNDEYVEFAMQYLTDKEIKELQNIHDTEVIKIDNSLAIASIPMKYLSEFKKFAKEIIIKFNPLIFTLSDISPADAIEIQAVNTVNMNLNGNGVLIAVIDTGIDYLNEEFMYEDGTTRIISILDQSSDEARYDSLGDRIIGIEYTEDQINEAIKADAAGGNPYEIVPCRDENGHGTMMAGIVGARGINPEVKGIIPDCRFIIIKLKDLNKNPSLLKYCGIPDTTKNIYSEPDIMLAVDYADRMAKSLNMPLCICLGLGTNMGSHDGSDILSKMLERVTSRTKTMAVTGTGNQGDTQTHTEGIFSEDDLYKDIDIRIGPNQKDLNMTIIAEKPDLLEVEVISPSGEILKRVPLSMIMLENYKFVLEGTSLNLYYVVAHPDAGNENIILKFRNLSEGTWKCRIYPKRLVQRKYWAWILQRELLDPLTKMVDSVTDTTLTIPSTSRGVLAVSYYDQNMNSVVASSGLGYTRDGRIKPDVTSPGIGVPSINIKGGVKPASGSSVGTAVAAGTVGMILQWAVTENNFNNITLQSLITYVISGAKERTGSYYPNKEWGYGILNIKNIIESFRGIKEKMDRELIRFKDLEEHSKKIKKREYNLRSLFIRIPEFNDN